MAVLRNLWKPKFWAWPQLPCPRCKVGTLRIDKKSISRQETKSSEAAHSHEAWDPEWIEERFMAVLTCTNPSCEDNVFVCGTIGQSIYDSFDEDGHSQYNFDDVFAPHFFEPAPPVFPIPNQCPNDVADELIKAFALVWSDIGSSGNRLRVAIEALLNALGVEGKAKIKSGKGKGKFRSLTLHERIEKFGEKHDEAGNQLLAIKWLGNTGSHAGLIKLTHDDVLNAFEHFEYALDLIYVNTSAKLAKRARQIINKKGPVTRVCGHSGFPKHLIRDSSFLLGRFACVRIDLSSAIEAGLLLSRWFPARCGILA